MAPFGIEPATFRFVAQAVTVTCNDSNNDTGNRDIVINHAKCDSRIT